MWWVFYTSLLDPKSGKNRTSNWFHKLARSPHWYHYTHINTHTHPYLYCWWSFVLRVLAMNLSASFSRFLEYSVSISDFFLKKSCRSWSSWTRISVCCSRHRCCSTNWVRTSTQEEAQNKDGELERCCFITGFKHLNHLKLHRTFSCLLGLVLLTDILKEIIFSQQHNNMIPKMYLPH